MSIGLYLQRKHSSFAVTISRLEMIGNIVAIYCEHTHINHGMLTSAELPNDKAGGTNAVIPECFKPLTFSFSEPLILSNSQKQGATNCFSCFMVCIPCAFRNYIYCYQTSTTFIIMTVSNTAIDAYAGVTTSNSEKHTRQR